MRPGQPSFGHENSHPNPHEHPVSVCTLSMLLGSVLGHDKQALHNFMGALFLWCGLIELSYLPYCYCVRSARSRHQISRTIIHQHPELGLKILEKCQETSVEVQQIVAEHHFTFSQLQGDTKKFPQDFRHRNRLVRIIDEYEELLSSFYKRQSIELIRNDTR